MVSQVAKRILHYLQGTSSHGIHLRRSTDLQITTYIDADWAGCPNTRRSTTRYAVFVGLNLISWRSKKQATVYKSYIEAKYRALAYVIAETLWLRQLIQDVGHHSLSLIIACCDNAILLEHGITYTIHKNLYRRFFQEARRILLWIENWSQVEKRSNHFEYELGSSDIAHDQSSAYPMIILKITTIPYTLTIVFLRSSKIMRVIPNLIGSKPKLGKKEGWKVEPIKLT
ncbi:hypothetical protein CRG98_018720 [Punica granatum]|uniref:Reverse transcriptase Ty1/copia-type domain-containing protein n=1 Tax=Punica granatum TaxID=22663 RepID=A0A2I0JX73_PUNGR|nr:hypothetical protein CRG98_018720 [Punica granatum]